MRESMAPPPSHQDEATINISGGVPMEESGWGHSVPQQLLGGGHHSLDGTDHFSVALTNFKTWKAVN